VTTVSAISSVVHSVIDVAVVVIGFFLHTVSGRLPVVVIIVDLGAGVIGSPGRGRGNGSSGRHLMTAVVDGDRRIGLNRLRRVALRRGVR